MNSATQIGQNAINKFFVEHLRKIIADANTLLIDNEMDNKTAIAFVSSIRAEIIKVEENLKTVSSFGFIATEAVSNPIPQSPQPVLEVPTLQRSMDKPSTDSVHESPATSPVVKPKDEDPSLQPQAFSEQRDSHKRIISAINPHAADAPPLKPRAKRGTAEVGPYDLFRRKAALKFVENPAETINVINGYAHDTISKRDTMKYFEIEDDKDETFVKKVCSFMGITKDAKKETLKQGVERLFDFTKALRIANPCDDPCELDADFTYHPDYINPLWAIFNTNKRHIKPSDLYVAFGLCNAERTHFITEIALQSVGYSDSDSDSE